jgi:MFS family permease
MFAKSRLLDPTPRFPPMRWREPVLLWAPVAFALSVGWPILALGSGLGLTLLVAFGVAFTTFAALAFVRAMQAVRKPPRARRDIVLLFLAFGAVAAIAAPVLAAGFSGAVGTQGYAMGMATAMWPLGLMLGAPIALFAGLAFSLVMFIKPPVREPDLEAAAPPRAVDGDDDGDDH